MSDAAVYQTGSVFEAHYLAEALNDAGIASFVDNENSMMAMGEIGIFHVHVLIRDAERLPEASRIVTELLSSMPDAELVAPPWKCACGQLVGAQFTACWKCGAEHTG